jgi:tRNA dimethylallyltransferase
MRNKFIIVIQGPTASGKTALAIQIAKHFGAEIISADSRQFYQEMNIGTAKPSVEERREIKHHFVDFLSVRQEYTVADYEKQALAKIQELQKNNILPLVVGGSGLFVDALLKGINKIPETDETVRKSLNEKWKTEGLYALVQELKACDPLSFQRIDLKNPRRIIRALEVFRTTSIPYSEFLKEDVTDRPFQSIKVAIETDREELYERIDKRCDAMLNAGLLKEVKDLWHLRHFKAMQSIGYTEFFNYLDKETELEDAILKFKQHSRNYAKRQMTWLRKDKDVFWYTPSMSHAQLISYLETRMKE